MRARASPGRPRSHILVAVLEELMGRGIVALGLHDGLIVLRSREAAAGEAMRRVALEVAEVSIPVRGATSSATPIATEKTPTDHQIPT